jgi:hypothetical protein
MEAQTQPPAMSPRIDQFEGVDFADGLFDQKREGDLNAKLLESALVSLLARHPEAPALATGPDGVAVPMPASAPLNCNPVLEAHTGMDLIVPSDRV